MPFRFHKLEEALDKVGEKHGIDNPRGVVFMASVEMLVDSLEEQEYDDNQGED